MKSYRFNNPGNCTKCNRAIDDLRFKKCAHCRWHSTEGTRKEYEKLRNELIEYYSEGKNCCACCGEKEPMFLSLDHINNDGYTHRQETNSYGSQFYKKMKAEGFPRILQVLCMNCNHGKMRNKGICPHKGKVDRTQFTPPIEPRKTGVPIGTKRSEKCKLCNNLRITPSGDKRGARCQEHLWIRINPRKPSEGREIGDLRSKENRSEGYNTVKRDNVTGMYLPVEQEAIYED